MGRGGRKTDQINGPVQYSWEEIKKHRFPHDSWMVYQDKVYNVSNWNDHPGGNVIFTHAGDDFTDIFHAFHPSKALKALDRFYIGNVDPSSTYERSERSRDTGSLVIKEQKVMSKEERKEFVNAYRNLRSKLMAMGMYKASILYSLYEIISTFSLCLLSIYCVVGFESTFMHMLGAVIMGLFWQQSGWMTHLYAHNSKASNTFYNELFVIIFGNVWQGFSMGWWKNKHNTHHAVPNLHASSAEAHDGDPDIDTMPFLAWSFQMAKAASDSKIGRIMVTNQSIFYFPILFIARISWAAQSFFFVFDMLDTGLWSTKGSENDQKRGIKHKELEMAGLILHYIALFTLMFNYMPFWEGIMFYFISSFACGLFLALVFGLGHNGMAVYMANDRPDFFNLQVTTTRNIKGNWFVHWFCGGLQYQVEHHLFPRIPNRNLGKVSILVKSFCKEWNVDYHETDMLSGTKEILNHLDFVTDEFVTQFPAL